MLLDPIARAKLSLESRFVGLVLVSFVVLHLFAGLVAIEISYREAAAQREQSLQRVAAAIHQLYVQSDLLTRTDQRDLMVTVEEASGLPLVATAFYADGVYIAGCDEFAPDAVPEVVITQRNSVVERNGQLFMAFDGTGIKSPGQALIAIRQTPLPATTVLESPTSYVVLLVVTAVTRADVIEHAFPVAISFMALAVILLLTLLNWVRRRVIRPLKAIANLQSSIAHSETVDCDDLRTQVDRILAKPYSEFVDLRSATTQFINLIQRVLRRDLIASGTMERLYGSLERIERAHGRLLAIPEDDQHQASDVIAREVQLAADHLAVIRRQLLDLQILHRWSHAEIAARFSPLMVSVFQEFWPDQLRMFASLNVIRPGARITVQLDPSMPDRLLFSPEALSTVLYHFVHNALSHGGPGMTSVIVRLSMSGTKSSPSLRLLVADNGRGIPAHARISAMAAVPVIPSPDAPPSSGLAVVAAIAKSLSGSVRVYANSASAGTVMAFTLPVQAAVAAPLLRSSVKVQLDLAPDFVPAAHYALRRVGARVVPDADLVFTSDPSSTSALRWVPSSDPLGEFMGGPFSAQAFVDVCRNLVRYEPTLPGVSVRPVVVFVDDLTDVVLRYAEIYSESFNVREFDNPLSALRYVAEHGQDVDCFVIDIHMPQMDGVELLHRIRALGNNAPAIAYTAFAVQSQHDALIAAGFTRVCFKPLSADVFYSYISQVLNLDVCDLAPIVKADPRRDVRLLTHLIDACEILIDALHEGDRVKIMDESAKLRCFVEANNTPYASRSVVVILNKISSMFHLDLSITQPSEPGSKIVVSTLSYTVEVLSTDLDDVVRIAKATINKIKKSAELNGSASDQRSLLGRVSDEPITDA